MTEPIGTSTTETGDPFARRPGLSYWSRSPVQRTGKCMLASQSSGAAAPEPAKAS